jgi:hypothetical protein
MANLAIWGEPSGFTEHGRLAELLQGFVVSQDSSVRRLGGITADAADELLILLPNSLTSRGVEAAPSLRDAAAVMRDIPGVTLVADWLASGRPDEGLVIKGLTVASRSHVEGILNRFGPLVDDVDMSAIETHDDGSVTVWYQI